METAVARIVTDLAAKAAQDAMEAVLRTARLGATPAVSLGVVAIALSLIEAKSRIVRAKMPIPEVFSGIVDALEKEEDGFFDTAVATVLARRGGGALMRLFATRSRQLALCA